jgi:hypothetical protein
VDFAKTDPPRWFVEAVQDISVGELAERLMLVQRRARYLAAEDERSALYRAQVLTGAGAMQISGHAAQLLVELLWVALGALDAAGVAHPVEPHADA